MSSMNPNQNFQREIIACLYLANIENCGTAKRHLYQPATRNGNGVVLGWPNFRITVPSWWIGIAIRPSSVETRALAAERLSERSHETYSLYSGVCMIGIKFYPSINSVRFKLFRWAFLYPYLISRKRRLLFSDFLYLPRTYIGFYPRPVSAFGYCHRLLLCVCPCVCVSITCLSAR